MTLLDAILAFALTMAAFATIVTILMEILIRCLGLRRKDQVVLVQKLYDKAIAPRLPESVKGAVKQWDVVKAVLENPFVAGGMAASPEAQGYSIKQSAAIYTEFSLEHLLRRVVDVEELKTELGKTHAEVVKRLTELGQKYDECRSAIGADFKRKAQFWSVLVGIAVAGVMNVDALGLFQAYLDDPKLTERVIDRMEPVLTKVEESQADLNEAMDTAAGEQKLDGLIESVDGLKAQAAFVHEFNLPVGQHYFPHCFLLFDETKRVASPDPRCAGGYDWGESLLWFLKVLVTGLLIGLGAPFWYDVAKRVAEIRRAFGGRGSAEQRHAGSDASETPEARGALIRRIARDVLA